MASGLFFLIAAIQTPGLDPPPESAALFLVVASAATISYVLLPARGPTGYLASMLTAVGVWVLLGVVVSGMYGAGGPRTNPVGPIWYALLAAGVFVAAGLAWRTGDGSARESRP